MGNVISIQKDPFVVGHEKPNQPGAALDHPAVAGHDDLDREVYCVLGVPVDAVDMPTVLRKIDNAAATKTTLVISTPNINFLVNSRSNAEFRESLLLSDLNPLDSTPLLWITKVLGIPVNERVAGSDIFDTLKSRSNSKTLLKIFLFGATDDVASAASEQMNNANGGVRCVGWACPGFGSIDDLSTRSFIDQINASGADFLVVALGASNGQAWLLRNHDLLRVPIRAHLGAVINFEAGTVKRAPKVLHKLGLEWLWRIKEEPTLWRRYWRDGKALLGIFLWQVLPLALTARRQRSGRSHDFVMVETQNDHTLTIHLRGHALGSQAHQAAIQFRRALLARRQVVLDCSDLVMIDARFLGLLLMLRKQLVTEGNTLRFLDVSPKLARQLRRNGLDGVFSIGGENAVSTAR